MPKYYITTAIPYASAKPHIGNTFEAVFTDAIARYRKLRGDDVFMLTGMDEHGQKIQRMAHELGITPQELVDENTRLLRANWDLCHVEYDDFIRTTDPRHKEIVKKIFKKLHDQGDIYKGSYEGWYCLPEEKFFTDSQITDSQVCPECGRGVEKASEEAYFFRLSKYSDRLARHIEQNPEFIMPDSRRNEMVNNFIKMGLQDFCVSRTSFSWGIEIDFDPAHVMYVWVDALSNYITALGYDPDGNHGRLFKRYWPCDVHVIGKDILRFHTLYWPALLMALDIPLPKQIFAHPWFLMGQDKMSKSMGNVIYAEELCSKYGTDAVRHYLLREMPYAQDGSITREQFILRCNADLSNNLGNLLSRTVTMGEKYFAGTLALSSCAGPDEYTHELDNLATEVKENYAKSMDVLSVANAMQEIFKLLDRANLYIDQTMPWALAKDEGKKAELCLVLHNLCKALQQASVLLYPIMPVAVKLLRQQLGLPETPGWKESLPDGYSVKRGPVLFPRIKLSTE
ncbi:MAG: methionine--tRNA ligase [Oscillospiraceae bacterium]|nr:methionine--tRNA ligase [Oscillospiraceae bacterium]